jgi:adenine specific DNA methylase Mod
MKTLISNQKKITTVKIDITKDEKAKAKQYAKKQGYSFQWWLGSLVREELEKDIDTP